MRKLFERGGQYSVANGCAEIRPYVVALGPRNEYLRQFPFAALDNAMLGALDTEGWR